MERHIKGVRNQGNHNTEPESYVVDVLPRIYSRIAEPGLTPSDQVVAALQHVDGRIQTRGFRQAVLDAIFEDALCQDYDDEEYVAKLRARLVRRFGAKRSREILVARVDILDSWRNRDASMVPDAFLVDKENRTVVCYEVEDTHPLNPRSIVTYGGAWFTLEYIYWDLHLIAYDPYGHARCIVFPHADLVAQEILSRGRSRRDA